MANNVHIIQRQRYEIKTRRQQTAMEIQNRLQEMNTYYVLPHLAKKLDSWFSPDEICMIEKIELDIGRIRSNTSDDEWTRLIMEKLEEQIKLFHKMESKIEKSQRHVVHSWIWFLKHGVLPAKTIYENLYELEKDLPALDDKVKQLIKEFLLNEANESVITRLVANSNPEIKQFHLQLFFDSGIDRHDLNIDQLVSALQIRYSVQRSTLSQFIWEKVFWFLKTQVSSHAITHGRLKTFIQETISDLMDSEKDETSDSKNEKLIEVDRSPNISQKSDDENKIGSLAEPELFISNAGLCLLAPWISPFFKQLKLTNDDKFSDKIKQQHVVYLLHYLVTGDEEPTEELLLFPKLLCGWPLQMPVVNSYNITEEEKNECEDLLNSVIQNWEVLKNTSIEGLRGSFLQRTGKLIGKEDHFVLQPEQQSIDLLLEYVPWTFRYIRLPWMKRAIQVEWY